jgi:hypothetical protein
MAARAAGGPPFGKPLTFPAAIPSALARSDDDTGLCLHAYPVLQHIKHLADGKIIWAPDIDGGFVAHHAGR